MKVASLGVSVIVVAAILAGCKRPVIEAAESPAGAPPTTGAKPVEKACFAAGCFWGVEAAFRKVPGVLNATCGYTGGKTDVPTYKLVCTGRTGHAEAVLVEYDPQKVSYEKLVEFFFSIHDPTTLNRQGPDRGTQYRSGIFYQSPEEKQTAEAVKERLTAAKKFKRPIVTEITEATTFWPAEEYHQRYFEKHGGAACHVPQ